MSATAVSAHGLGKRYRIGTPAAPYGSLRESLVGAVRAPLHYMHRALQRHGAIAGEANGHSLWALHDVSFDLRHGEAVGIIGRNGAGKSTLLKILSRITEPTTGRVELYGRVGSLLEVGTGFHPELTGRENIYLNGTILGMTRSDVKRRFDDIIAFAEVERFIDTPVKRYSSGMYLRLAFAVAAHLEPDILVVDEVLAVGDAQFQKKCLSKMQDVAGEGRTVLFVSHNMAAIDQLTSRALLLQGGRLVQSGPTREVISSYLTTLSSASEGIFDVTSPELRRNSLDNSRFKWTSVTFRASGGESTSLIHLQEPFEIVLRAKVSGDVEDLRAGFAVSSAMGYPVFSSYQSDGGLPTELRPGDVEYRVAIRPNLLAPGSYDVGLGANGPGVVDWLPVAAQFTISDVGLDETVTWDTYRGGMLAYPCRWSREAPTRVDRDSPLEV